MGIVKVSIYQKSLNQGLNLAIYKKLGSVKSDFLLFPEFFYADSSVNDMQSLADRSQYALDWLIKLNEVYKGIIIGGSMIRQENDAFFSATPIISEGSVIDWYKKRNIEDSFLTAGSEPGIFILKGQRFGILAAKDMEDPEILKELSDEGIRLIFSLVNIPEGTKAAEDDFDAKVFQQSAIDNDFYIARCCSTGSFLGQNLLGRSMVMTPRGISWKIAPQEESEEILKTVMIQL